MNGGRKNERALQLPQSSACWSCLLSLPLLLHTGYPHFPRPFVYMVICCFFFVLEESKPRADRGVDNQMDYVLSGNLRIILFKMTSNDGGCFGWLVTTSLHKLLQYLRFQNKPPNWRPWLSLVWKKTVLMFSEGRKTCQFMCETKETRRLASKPSPWTLPGCIRVCFLDKNTHSPPQSKYFFCLCHHISLWRMPQKLLSCDRLFSISDWSSYCWSTLLLKPFRVGLLESEVGFFETAKFFAKSNFLFS